MFLLDDFGGGGFESLLEYDVFIFWCFPLCQSVGRSVCPSVCPSVCVHLTDSPFVSLVYLSAACLSLHPFVSICMPVWLSVCLSVSICLTAHLSLCPSVCVSLSATPPMGGVCTDDLTFPPT